MKKTKIKVQGNPNLIRDSFSKAIVNVDPSAYANHRNRKMAILKKDKKIETLEETIARLESENVLIKKTLVAINKKLDTKYKQ